MSDNWQPGDDALCVNARPIQCKAGLHVGLRAAPEGRLRKVAAVGVSRFGRDECGCAVLHFTDGRSGLAQRFRKINPLNEAERAAALRELNTPEFA